MHERFKKIAMVTASIGIMVAVAAAPITSNMFQQTGYVAASAADEIKSGYQAAGGDDSDSNDLNSIVGTIVNTMLFIVGVLAVVMIIYSGIRYITAHGDKGQVEGAKNTLIYSIVGLIVAIVAYALVNWVLDLFGGGSASGGSSTGGSSSGGTASEGTVSYVIDIDSVEC